MHPLSTSKKNVLVIGDSVSNGYFLECGNNSLCVPGLLSDVAVAQHAPWSPGSGGAGPTQHGLDCLDIWLKLCDGSPAKYDLISFNFGLHDLDNATQSLAEYSAQLSNITRMIQAAQPQAKLLYISTTPMMPTCCKGGPLVPAGEGAPRPECTPADSENL